VVEEEERKGQATSVPIVEGVFGWGRLFQLYPDHLLVEGVSYALRDLTLIRPVYRTLLGVPSARLELTFGEHRLILRGIAAIQDVETVVDYLVRACPQARLVTAGRASSENAPPLPGVSPIADPEDLPTTDEMTLLESLQAPDSWQHARQELLRRRQERFAEEQRRREAEAGRRPGRGRWGRVRKDALPSVQVPVRLAAGERAFYRCEATLCHEQPLLAPQGTGVARDHGLLILTDRRLIYMGRRCQILLGYDHLLQVVRQRSGVAFLADHWQRRELFTLRRPLECVLCLEKLLWRFQQERQLSTLMRIDVDEELEQEERVRPSRERVRESGEESRQEGPAGSTVGRGG
jgi:hypothetical protein